MRDRECACSKRLTAPAADDPNEKQRNRHLQQHLDKSIHRDVTDLSENPQ